MEDWDSTVERARLSKILSSTRRDFCPWRALSHFFPARDRTFSKTHVTKIVKIGMKIAEHSQRVQSYTSTFKWTRKSVQMQDLDSTPPLGPETLFRELRSAGTTSEEHARKIQLASSAWRSSTTRVPRKGQFILEWLLERLLKTRSDDGWVSSCYVSTSSS